MQDLTVAAYTEYAAMLPEYAWEMYREDMVTTIEQEIANSIVAEQDGEIVGSVVLIPAGTSVQDPAGEPVTLEWPEIRLLAVPPDQRGKGIGRRLTEECVRRASESGKEAITLHTGDIMSTAMQMYERMGFVRFPSIDFFPEPDFVIKGYIYRLKKTQA